MTLQAGHDWHEVDVTDAFSSWMANDEYRDAYFETPDDLRLKLEAEFAEMVAERIRDVLHRENPIIASGWSHL